jgi:dsDNA-binding SOS-regulon protein
LAQETLRRSPQTLANRETDQLAIFLAVHKSCIGGTLLLDTLYGFAMRGAS